MIGVEPSASEVDIPGYASTVPPPQRNSEGLTAQAGIGFPEADPNWVSATILLENLDFLNSSESLGPLNVSSIPFTPESQPSQDVVLVARGIPAQPCDGQANMGGQPAGQASSSVSVVSLSPESSPVPSPSPMEKTTSIPRHKRPSHKRAELKRRCTIKERLADLAEEIGAANSKKLSEIDILTKAAGFTRNLEGQRNEMNQEKERLRSLKRALNADLAEMQKGLPASGFVKETTPVTMNELFESAKEKRNSEKFLILSKCFETLFKTFQESTAEVKTESDLQTSTMKWASEINMLGLRNAGTKGCLDLMKRKPAILSEKVLLSSTPALAEAKTTFQTASTAGTTATATSSGQEQATEVKMAPTSSAAAALTMTSAVAATTSGAAVASTTPTAAEPMVKLEDGQLFADFLLPLVAEGRDDVFPPFLDASNMQMNFDVFDMGSLMDYPEGFPLAAELPMEEQWS